VFEKMILSGKYFVLIAVVASWLAALTTFLWGAFHLIEIIQEFIQGAASGHIPTETGIGMISVVDGFLIGTVLYIIAVGLYELFIGRLDVAPWLIIKNLDDLKQKLQSVIIMIMAVLFLSELARWQNPAETLMFALAISVVIAALTYFGKSKGNEPKVGAEDNKG